MNTCTQLKPQQPLVPTPGAPRSPRGIRELLFLTLARHTFGLAVTIAEDPAVCPAQPFSQLPLLTIVLMYMTIPGLQR